MFCLVANGRYRGGGRMRLTKADELKKRLIPLSSSELKWVNEVDISNCTVVEAEPIRHGHWIPKPVMIRQPYAFNHTCSVCGKETNYCGNYCSNCGCKMDEVK